ncbi:hypothetical protein [Nocardioides lentus]
MRRTTHRTTRSTTRAAALLCAALLVATGCGQQGGDQGSDEPGADASAAGSPSPRPTADGFVPGDPRNEVRRATAADLEDWPACDDVWRAGGTIPEDYEGCVDGDDAVVADLIRCSFGGTMTTFDDRFHGVVGNVVNDAGQSLADDQAYAKAYRLCSA